MKSVRRLHWGCGLLATTGWVNSDIMDTPGVDIVADIRKGLPLPDNDFDYIASQHSLGDLKIYEQVGILKELCRVLRPGGVLRLGLPDLDLLIAAYQKGDTSPFLIHDWETIAGNFITHMLWYNITQTPFTFAFVQELMSKAGFVDIVKCEFRKTASTYLEIVELDGREAESFFVEGSKPV